MSRRPIATRLRELAALVADHGHHVRLQTLASEIEEIAAEMRDYKAQIYALAKEHGREEGKYDSGAPPIYRDYLPKWASRLSEEG